MSMARLLVPAALAELVTGCGGEGGSNPQGPGSVVPTPTPAPTLAPVEAPGPPWDRGPAPSVSALEADEGPFSVGTLVVDAATATGYRQGTVSYPLLSAVT